MRDNVSPEEKLLKLIRGQKKTGSPSDRPHLVNAQDPKASKNSLQGSSLLKYPPLLNINKIIITIFIFSCVYLVFTFLYPMFIPEKINLPKATEHESSGEKNVSIQEIKPFEFYSEGLKTRQLFTSPSGSEPEKTSEAVNSDLIKDLNLVGIMAGDTPQAVIEDKKAQKTYYVTKGQLINEFKVDEIREGKIILNYRGAKFELYL